MTNNIFFGKEQATEICAVDCNDISNVGRGLFDLKIQFYKKLLFIT